jgi:kynurenine formamidase
MSTRADPRLTLSEFNELFQAVSNWGRWGPDDQRGALNYLTGERVVAAAALIRTGRTISLSLPLNTHAGIENPEPADHHMTMLGDAGAAPGGVQFAKDYIGIDYHNDSHTHIDAFCHVAFDGRLYNGVPSDSITADGGTAGTIQAARHGLIGRGVLLDVPRLRGVPWLEPGENIFRDDLEVAEREQGVTVGEGDILLVRTGHPRRLRELGAWDTAHAKAGLHPNTAPFLHERAVSVLGCDGNSDTAPNATEGVDFPMHVLALTAMGVPLLDYLQLDDVAAACASSGRWEFFFAAAPLRIVGGTGSPLNPIAVL